MGCAELEPDETIEGATELEELLEGAALTDGVFTSTLPVEEFRTS